MKWESAGLRSSWEWRVSLRGWAYCTTTKTLAERCCVRYVTARIRVTENPGFSPSGLPKSGYQADRRRVKRGSRQLGHWHELGAFRGNPRSIRPALISLDFYPGATKPFTRSMLQ